jgi:hypothetical protein
MIETEHVQKVIQECIRLRLHKNKENLKEHEQRQNH